MEVTYGANLDFELSLATGKLPSQKVLRDSEWLPLWCTGKVAGRYPSYSKQFLLGIEKIREEKLVINQNFQEVYWWSHPDSSDVNKFLNSKFTAQQCREDLAIDLLEGIIVESGSLETSYIFKKEFSAYGRGVSLNYNGQRSLRQKKQEIIFEISSYGISDDSVFYLSEVGEDRQFKGITLAPENDLEYFKKFFKDQEQWLFCCQKIKILNQLVRSWYNCQGATFPYSVDLMIDSAYQVHFNEVNYRKTMGAVALELQSLFGSQAQECRLRRGGADQSGIRLTPEGILPYFWHII